MAVINGTPGDDRGANELVGTNAADSIFGFDGRDDLTGLEGDDTLDGGAGDRDSARYFDAPAGINGSLTSNTVSDGYGDTDTLIEIEEIRGSDYNDTLTGATGGEVFLRGRGGDDIITANNFSTFGGTNMDGGSGNDTITNTGGEYSFIEPGTGADSIVGAVASFDIVSYFYSAGYDNPPATQGIVVTFTGEGEGTIIDYAGDADSFTSVERVEGTMFADVMTGSTGFQSFQGRGGNDTIDGGDDVDEVNYSGVRDDFGAESGVTVDLSTSTATDKFGNTDTLFNIEQVRGSRFADDITGNAVDNRLRGLDGDDTLVGGAGNDRLEGGNDDDSLDGGEGSDNLFGGAGNDTLLGGGADSSQFDYLQGDAGNDYLEITGFGSGVGGEGDDTIIGIPPGSAPTDAFVGALYFDAPAAVAVNLTGVTQFGLAGGDTVNGFFADDGFGTVDTLLNLQRVEGTSLDDLFAIDSSYIQTYGNWIEVLPGAGNDDIAVLGSAQAFLIYDNVGAAVTADLDLGTATDLSVSTNEVGSDTFGTAGLFRGSTFGDSILGGSSIDDFIEGIDGDDTIDGRAGNDNLFGGDGSDELFGSEGFDTLDGGEGGDTLDGGADFDIANYLGSTARIEIDLTAGTFVGGDAQGDSLVGIEAIWASNLNDLIVGDGGENNISGWGGNDNINGRGGDDMIAGDDGDDLISGGNGDDILQGWTDNDLIYGNGDNDQIEGGSGNDTVYGGAGSDHIDGGAGQDSLIGQGSADTILGNDGADTILGGSGNDSIEGGLEDDRLFGNGNNDTLDGGAGNDVLQGAAGSDVLRGGEGNDTLTGSIGADRLDGGAGNDVMNGGGADGVRDFYVFGVGYDQDRINAFDQAGTDLLQLDEDLWSATNPGLTEQQVIDTFGTLNGTGTILTLDFGGGDILEVQNAAGIDQSTLGADVTFV